MITLDQELGKIAAAVNVGDELAALVRNVRLRRCALGLPLALYEFHLGEIEAGRTTDVPIMLLSEMAKVLETRVADLLS